MVNESRERTSDRSSSSIEMEARPAVTGGPTPVIRAKMYSCRIDCGMPSKLTSISVRVERYAGSKYLSCEQQRYSMSMRGSKNMRMSRNMGPSGKPQSTKSTKAHERAPYTVRIYIRTPT